MKSTLVIVAAVPTVSVMIPDWILALVIAKSVAKPTVTLISSTSTFTKSRLVIVAAVPTVSVTASPVMFTSLASRVSMSTTLIVE